MVNKKLHNESCHWPSKTKDDLGDCVNCRAQRYVRRMDEYKGSFADCCEAVDKEHRIVEAEANKYIKCACGGTIHKKDSAMDMDQRFTRHYAHQYAKKLIELAQLQLPPIHYGEDFEKDFEQLAIKEENDG